MAHGETRAMVLLSGGIDSAVALHWALEEGWEALPLSFDYHLRPAAELRAVEALLAQARPTGQVAPLRRVALPFLREVEDLPSPRPSHLEHAPASYIPARNLVFYGIAASLAEAIGATRIVGGQNVTDGDTFPDASPRFFTALNQFLRQAVWSHSDQPLDVVLPLAGRTKAEVVDLGHDLGVPFEATWSCYRDGEAHCGGCLSCEERREAFARAQHKDPARYRAPLVGSAPGGDGSGTAAGEA